MSATGWYRMAAAAIAGVVLLHGSPSRASSGAPQSTLAPLPSDSRPVVPDDADRVLSARVSAEAVRLPAEELFRRLSVRATVRLEASPSVRDQRLTLSVNDLPLRTVMARIAALLSHSWPATGSYYWERTSAPGVKPAAFVLRRGAAAEAEAQRSRDEPRRQAVKRLTDMRNILHLPKAERASYVSDEPRAFYERADDPGPRYQTIKSLTDDQLTRLFKGRDVAVGSTTLCLVPLDISGYVPSRANLYGLQEFGPAVDDGVLLLNDYTTAWKAEPLQEPNLPNGVQPKIFDLGPSLNSANVTDDQRADPALILAALARIAGVNVYQEFFYKLGDNGLGIRPKELPTTRGTVTQLLNAVCQTWGYQALRTEDGDYLIWSRTWAMDRLCDIADSELEPWRRKLTAQGHFQNEDIIRIASTFTWPQVRVPLSVVIPQSVNNPFLCGTTEYYWHRRLLGTLTDSERAAAESEKGIAIGSLSQNAQQAFWQWLYAHNAFSLQHAPGGPLKGEEALNRQGAGALLRLKPYDSGYTAQFIEENGPEQLILTAADGSRL